MIDKQLAYDCLSVALSNGARFAELFIENNVKSSVSLVNSFVENAVSGIDYGIGIRIFTGDRIIYTYTNDFSRDNLIKCCLEAGNAMKGTDNIKPKDFVFERVENKHKAVILPSEVKKSAVVDMLKSASSVAFDYDARITQTSAGYSDSIQDVCIINSEGLWAEDTRIRTRATVNAVASDETEKQSGYFGPGGLCGYEFYETINLDKIAKEASRSAVTMLSAKECPAGRMPVIIDNGFGGVIFHEACGHGLEACAVAKKASVFADKIGQRIASEKLTAIDDGTLPNKWGSVNIDDEGIKGRRNVLIENGILKGYMTDRFNGERLNLAPTGSSRRQSYKLAPVSRMTNTFIASGNDKAEDIIKSTKLGLYAKYMGGGSVNPASGEFNFAVNEAYIVRNGEICEPVRGATLIGKGSEVLMNIDMVSDNLLLAEGMCGASSGSVPVCVGQPMIRVSEITVGGKGGSL